MTPEQRAELRRQLDLLPRMTFVTQGFVMTEPDNRSGNYPTVYREQLIALLDAADERDRLAAALVRIVDKRTLMQDGFWVSKREMRYAEKALKPPVQP